MTDHIEDYKHFKKEFLSCGQIGLAGEELQEEEFLRNKIDALFLTCNQFAYISGLPEFSMLFLSRNIIKLLGYEHTELSIDKLYELVHPMDKEILFNSIMWCMNMYKTSRQKFEVENSVFSVDYRIKHKEGHYIRFLRNTTILKSSPEAKIVYLLNIFTDISDQKKTGLPEARLKLKEQEVLKYCFENTLFTQREMDVLTEMTNGLSSKEIADKLCIGESTVITHRKNMLKKTGLKKTVELVKYAIDNSIV